MTPYEAEVLNQLREISAGLIDINSAIGYVMILMATCVFTIVMSRS